MLGSPLSSKRSGFNNLECAVSNIPPPDANPDFLDPEDAEPDDFVLNTGDKPWDPNKIRIQTKTFSLRQVVDEIKEGTIDLAPDFQRDYVWKEEQKSLLIESIVLGIPLPVFYFSQEEDGRIQVVDGVQRLSTIRDFFENRFVPSFFEYRTDLKGISFDQLEPAWKRRFRQAQIVVHVIDPQTPPDLKFDIFRRINTGGTPLSPQEIRHCMAKARSRAFLERLVGTPLFIDNLGEGLRARMVDRELALRFIAFRDPQSIDSYEESRTFDGFLLNTMKRLDDPKEFPDSRLKTLEADFDRGLRNSLDVFGEFAFRRWEEDRIKRPRLNKALFEAWMVALCEVGQHEIEEYATEIIKEARLVMTHDLEFRNSISVATGDRSHVRYRFQKAHQIAHEAGR